MGGSTFCPRWALVLVFLLLPYAVIGQILSSPSNSSTENDPKKGTSKFLLETTQSTMSSSINLLHLRGPRLTYGQVRQYNVSGNLVDVKPEDANDISKDDIAYVSCDPSAYSGKFKVQDTLEMLVPDSLRAAAMVLYSTESDHCNYTDERSMPSAFNIFSVIGPDAARDVLQLLDSEETQTWDIVADDSSITSSEFDSDTGSNFPGDLHGSNTDNDRSPTSSVAMIVLYSVTGLITALFLSVIVTGAIRAHRHPERYGPRNDAGRPRQSRARGIARAMLETLPIVKFGDLNDSQHEAQKSDIEMASHDGDHDEAAGNGVERTESPAEQQRQGVTTPTPTTTTENRPAREDTNAEGDRRETAEQEAGHIGPASASPGSRTPNNAQDTAEPGNLECPICADRFVKGQDVRLLPCNHKFHPECVDPWLVNVSGTCPLCRIDLRPSSPSGEDASGHETRDGDGNLPPPLQTGTDSDPQVESHTQPQPQPQPRGHRRLSEYLQHTINAMPLRESAMAVAMERHRHSQQPQPHGETAPTAAGAVESTPTTDANGQGQGEGRRRNRLSQRVRERFHIRTRRHGEEPTAPPPAPPQPQSSSPSENTGQHPHTEHEAETPR